MKGQGEQGPACLGIILSQLMVNVTSAQQALTHHKGEVGGVPPCLLAAMGTFVHTEALSIGILSSESRWVALRLFFRALGPILQDRTSRSHSCRVGVGMGVGEGF